MMLYDEIDKLQDFIPYQNRCKTDKFTKIPNK